MFLHPFYYIRVHVLLRLVQQLHVQQVYDLSVYLVFYRMLFVELHA